MEKRLVLTLLSVASCLAALAGCDRPSVPALPDPFRLAEPKDFTAHRASSNNPDWSSNDDSVRPIPGETAVLADLEGPGVVTHLWMTIADNEYAWPRLLRLRVYYDGSPTPSVDAPVGDFFAVGHGFEGEVESTMVRSSSAGRARNCYWPMPFRRHVRVTFTNEAAEDLEPDVRRLGQHGLEAHPEVRGRAFHGERRGRADHRRWRHHRLAPHYPRRRRGLEDLAGRRHGRRTRHDPEDARWTNRSCPLRVCQSAV